MYVSMVVHLTMEGFLSFLWISGFLFCDYDFLHYLTGFLPIIESWVQFHGDPKLFNRSRDNQEMLTKIHREREMTQNKRLIF